MNTPGAQTDQMPGLVDRALLIRAAGSVVFVLLLAIAAGFMLQEQLEHAGAIFVEQLGYVGLALGVIVCDASLLPLTNEPLMVLALQGGMSEGMVFLVTCGSSVLAGFLGYTGGRIVGRLPAMQRFLDRRNPELTETLRIHGAKVVAAAALLPIPFSFSTWGAGALRVAPIPVAAACLLRVPKTGFYFWLLQSGLSLGGGS